MKLGKSECTILDLVQRQGRMTNVELARAANLSESACLRKMKALEKGGVITGYRATVEPRKLGLGISAHVLVNLDQRSETDTREFFDALQHEPRVIECVAITGPDDLLLRVVARDMDDLAELTMAGILSFPSVKDISSCVVMKEIKPLTPLPVTELPDTIS
jgi:Lrp/AsnC family leucine-responsive transcriptional regulator